MIIIDTETTGLDPARNALLQVSIIDDKNNILFDCHFKPSAEHYAGNLLYSWSNASKINNITPSDVENAPSFESKKDKIQNIINTSDVMLIYNAAFDIPFLQNNGITIPDNIEIIDVMLLFAEYYQEETQYDSYHWQKLTHAAKCSNYVYKPHNALEDCKATLAVFNAIKNKTALTYKQYHSTKIKTKFAESGVVILIVFTLLYLVIYAF